jgi:hypothetical protein
MAPRRVATALSAVALLALALAGCGGRSAEGVYVYSVTMARNGSPLTKSGVFHLTK